ncbi:MAG: hypothetical protein IKT77_01825 [Paludibacteraceae bacterium]|nr:hypothetical protein [Paludibacteraceae bacterium]MBR6519705.1 hypothetical protein [Paludibacteraceae bacterium]
MKTKIIGIISLVIILVVAGVIYFQYFFVFGEGVKAGELNYMVHKGYIFKTYEGKLIQSGFKGQSANGVATGIQSYEFQFSVTDESIADSLMRCSGKQVELHYKEYINPLVWRGVSEFVVDSIIAVK